MKTFFVGIDISKDWLDVAICDEESKVIILNFRSDNTVEGIEKLIRRCYRETRKSSFWVCFEHTGNYGLLLSQLLENQSVNYSAVSAIEIKRSIGMTRGKNDQIDASRIALYAATNKHKLVKSKLPGKQILRIKNLLTHRSLLLKISTQLQNSMKSFRVAEKTVEIQDIINDLNEKIMKFKSDIKQLEETIKTEIESDNELDKNFKRVITVKGVGLMIAATMIVHTNNFVAFDNPRSFNCYAGLAPFEYSSGSSIQGKNRTSKLRNKTMKTLLFNGANTAIMHDHELKAYYKRKKQEGKQHMTIINAVACKMVARIFAVVKREEPYVNLFR